MKPRFFRIKRYLRFLEKAWAVLGLTLLTLTGTELIVRALPASAPELDLPRLSPILSRSEWFEDYLEEAGGFHVDWHPYVYWRMSPMKGRHIRVDAQGRRRTWAPPPGEGTGDEAPLRIFMFGGSTLWGIFARDDFTIASHLAKILFREHGIRAEVTNFGEVGYVSTQELIALLIEVQKGNLPDLAVFYDGVNDVFSAFQNGVAGLPHQEWHRRAEFNLRKQQGAPARLLSKSLRNSGINRRLMKLGLRETPPPEYKDLPPDAAQRILEVYQANIRIVQALGEDLGFSCLFFWQPVVFSRADPTPYERLLESLALGSGPLYREVYRLVRSSGELSGLADFHDLSGIFDGDADPVFIDYCHITEEGGERVARYMAEEVLEVLKSREGDR